MEPSPNAPRFSWTFFVRAGFWFVLLTLPVYAGGYLASDMLTPRSSSDICGIAPMADPPFDQSLLPLSNRCLWLDGTSTELVPSKVNPLLLTLIGIATTLFLLGVRAFLRSRRLHRAEPTASPATPS